MKTAKRTSGEGPALDPMLVLVVAAFSHDRAVSRGGGKGFGSRALTVNGKIFAMMSWKDQFVVKLPRKRVDDLVAAGRGKYFDPGRRRLMKEWLAVAAGKTHWLELATEAYRFVKRG